MNTQSQKLLTNIIDYAETGEPITFHFIRTWREYSTIRKSARRTKLLVKSLQASHNKVFKRYCKSIPDRKTSFTQLLVCNTLKSTAAFYLAEYRILQDMIEEFESYLLAGNLLDAILLGYRSENKLWDHRSLSTWNSH